MFMNSLVTMELYYLTKNKHIIWTLIGLSPGYNGAQKGTRSVSEPFAIEMIKVLQQLADHYKVDMITQSTCNLRYHNRNYVIISDSIHFFINNVRLSQVIFRTWRLQIRRNNIGVPNKWLVESGHWHRFHQLPKSGRNPLGFLSNNSIWYWIQESLHELPRPKNLLQENLKNDDLDEMQRVWPLEHFSI